MNNEPEKVKTEVRMRADAKLQEEIENELRDNSEDSEEGEV